MQYFINTSIASTVIEQFPAMNLDIGVVVLCIRGWCSASSFWSAGVAELSPSSAWWWLLWHVLQYLLFRDGKYGEARWTCCDDLCLLVLSCLLKLSTGIWIYDNVHDNYDYIHTVCGLIGPYICSCSLGQIISLKMRSIILFCTYAMWGCYVWCKQYPNFVLFWYLLNWNTNLYPFKSI